MKKVLIVSYFFPPLPGMGALRVGKMAQYLPEFGYQPLVIAGGHFQNRRPQVYYPPIPDVGSMAKLLRGRLQQSSGPQSDPSSGVQPTGREVLGWWPPSGVRMPDGYLYWVIPAVIMGLLVIRRHRPDIIFSSSSPPSSAIAASILQLFSGLPWVAEFRDLWANNPYDTRIPSITRLDAFLESRVLKRATSLVTVTEPLAKYLRKNYAKPVNVVYNGFDPNDYPKWVNFSDSFTITYTGTITPGKQDPTPLFQAVKWLSDQGQISPSTFRIRFYGPELKDRVEPLATRYGVGQFCEIHDPVPHRACLHHQCESSLLLLLGWNHPRDEGLATGKLFEYLGAGRPILALGYPKSVMADILHTTNAGVVLNNPEHIANYLHEKIVEWDKKHIKERKIEIPQNLNKYSRRGAALQVAQIFDEVLQTG